MGHDTRVALVTGASRGIGRAIALALADAQFSVTAVSRPPQAGALRPGALDDLRREVEQRGSRCLPLHHDVADLAGHPVIIGAIEQEFGRLDVFVSNAGIAPSPRRDLLEVTPDSFDRLMGVNLRGALFLAQRAARYMVERPRDAASGFRSMVFVSSVSSERSSIDRAEYCIAKAGLSMAARVFADRLAGDGIAVFEVRPGIIRTDMTAAARDRYDARIADGLVPQGRWGEPEDVARTVVALARGDFPYSTGAIIEVGGGMGIPRF